MRFFISFVALILLFAYPHNTYATVLLQDNIQQDTQSYTEFKGIVIDSKTKEPLIFADLNVNSTNIRTVTNKEGEFLLKVPNSLLDKKITVTFLGYEKREIPLKDLKKNNNKIVLTASITELSQVNINIPKDALTLVKATLNKKGTHYYNDQAIMTAFYRETIKKGKKNASLTEAVVEIYKQPYISVKNDAI